MAKALFGHVGLGPDPKLAVELQRLRAQLHALELENEHLRAVNARLTESVNDMLDLSMPESAAEPALA
ncbi:MAG: hypothetical protein ACYCO3_16290 [Mycobacteriales bacterium]